MSREKHKSEATQIPKNCKKEMQVSIRIMEEQLKELICFIKKNIPELEIWRPQERQHANDELKTDFQDKLRWWEKQEQER